MTSEWALDNLASKTSYYVLIIITLLISFGAVQTANCWAAQTITVGVSDNLQTLVNNNPSSTTFSLAPGIHRLQSVVPKAYDSFVGQTGAILSGAALLTNFSHSGSYWIAQAQVTKRSSYPGTCDSAHPVCTLPEDLFFNNVLKTRVASLSLVASGTWYLDYGTGKVYMGDNPSGHTVEISVLPYAFSGGAASVTVSHVTIEKYACVAQDGAIQGFASTYWAIGWNEVRYNHGSGIRSGVGMWIHDNYVHHNGQLGIGGGSSGVGVQSNEIAFNNVSGYSYYWEAGGVKFSNSQNVTVRYNYSHDNSGPGYWADINSQNIIFDSNQATRNKEAGIMYEISSYGTISNNYIWNDGSNADGSNLWWSGGIMISNSSNVSVYFNNISNCVNGIAGLLASRGNAPNGQPYLLQNINVNNNTITQSTGTAAGIVEQSTFDSSVYTTWNNVFHANTFKLTDQAGQYFVWMGVHLTLAGWSGYPGTM
jgi:parallel beta-helix repeat protein